MLHPMHELDIQYTDKPITPFGGLTTVKRFYDRSGLQEEIKSLSLPQPGSNRAYDPVHLLESFLVSVLLGSHRLDHSGLLRHDKVISELFSWEKGMASENTFCRFFKKFDTELNEDIFITLNRWWFEKLNIKHHTIDIDSMVLTRYGNQEGVEVGYNPRKSGRGSHHPLIAFASEAKMVVQAWMRTRDSVSKTDLEDFFASVTSTIDKTNIGLIRADSGFFSNNTLAYLEKNQLKYIISAKMYSGLVQKIFDSKNWVPSRNGIDICSFDFKFHGCCIPRRFVIVRKLKSKNHKSGGKSFFKESDRFSKYLYSAFVTNIELSDAMVWALYHHRAKAETQIRELKENCGIDVFCCEEFGATEGAFRWVCVAYNLMSLYKIALINSKTRSDSCHLKNQMHCNSRLPCKTSKEDHFSVVGELASKAFFENLFKELEKITPQITFRPKRKFPMN